MPYKPRAQRQFEKSQKKKTQELIVKQQRRTAALIAAAEARAADENVIVVDFDHEDEAAAPRGFRPRAVVRSTKRVAMGGYRR